MASRIVTSPAGERVEIVEDDDWLKLVGADNDHGLRMWNAGKGGKPFVIMELWLGGKVEDQKTGRASSLLFDAMHSRFPDFEATNRNSISTMMLAPLNEPAFERIMNVKRTFSIRLIALPERWYRKMQRDLRDRGLDRTSPPVKEPPVPDAILSNPNIVLPIDQVNGLAGEEPIIDIEELLPPDIDLDAPTIFDIKPPLELTVAAQVAMSLLTTVVEIITAGSSETVDVRVRKLQDDMNDIAGKLSLRLSENDTLRRQVRESGDMIIALRTERDGLRSRLKATEANLTAALKGDAVHAINGEIMRRVDSIMRVAPSTPKGDD